jgi:hypothetical protein
MEIASPTQETCLNSFIIQYIDAETLGVEMQGYIEFPRKKSP